MDNGPEDTVAVARGELKGPPGLLQGEPVRRQEAHVHLFVSDEVDGFANAESLPADVVEGKLLAPEGVDIERNPVLSGNPDDEKPAAWLEDVHGLIKGRTGRRSIRKRRQSRPAREL